MEQMEYNASCSFYDGNTEPSCLLELKPVPKVQSALAPIRCETAAFALPFSLGENKNLTISAQVKTRIP